MARNQTATAPQLDENGQPVAAPAVARNPMISIAVPLEFKNILDEVAKNTNKSTAAWARDVLASTVNYTLPATAKRTRRSKYATAEERTAAVKTANAKRNVAASALMKALQAGETNLTLQEIVAKYGNGLL